MDALVPFIDAAYNYFLQILKPSVQYTLQLRLTDGMRIFHADVHTERDDCRPSVRSEDSGDKILSVASIIIHSDSIY